MWSLCCEHPCPLRRFAPALPKGEPFGYTSTTFYHTFPLATRLNGRKNSQNGQKSRKNACKALCRRPSEPKNTGGKTPESPKIPLQLGCSVTQIRHFFKRTFFNLPLIFENNVKKATVWLHQGGLPVSQSLSLWEQQRRPPPVAETGRSCWGRGQQDASESEADAGSRNPGSVTAGDGEGKDADGDSRAQR